MTREQEHRVMDVLCERLGVSKEKVVPGAFLVEDLGADSLDLVEVTMALEDEFDIEISDDDWQKIKTVKDALNCVGNKI